jgi:hypothetical protein
MLSPTDHARDTPKSESIVMCCRSRRRYSGTPFETAKSPAAMAFSLFDGIPNGRHGQNLHLALKLPAAIV